MPSMPLHGKSELLGVNAVSVCMCSLHEIRSDNGKLCMSAGAALVGFAVLSKPSIL